MATHHAAGEAVVRDAGLSLPDQVAVLELVWLRTADAIGDDPVTVPEWFETLVVSESTRRGKLSVAAPLTMSLLDTVDIAQAAWIPSIHASGAELARMVNDSTARLADRGLAVPLRDTGDQARDFGFECGSMNLRVRVFRSSLTGVVDGDVPGSIELITWSGSEVVPVGDDGRFYLDRRIDRAVALNVTTPDERLKTEWFLG